MKIIECIQGSPEWFEARIGIPTASEFSRIITPKTWKMSSQAEGYANLLIGEILLRESLDIRPPTFYEERGKLLEAEAVDNYVFEMGVKIKRAGFCVQDDYKYGCSVDVLVDEDGIAEMKCPNGETHMGYVFKEKVPDEHYAQVQGQLLVTKRKWNDWYSHYPALPSALIRTERDEGFISALEDHLDKFRTLMNDKLLRLVEMKKIDEKVLLPFKG